MAGPASVTTTLKSLASSLAAVCCEVETPVERTIALLPISVTIALKVLLGNGVNGDFGRLSHFDIYNIGFIHLALPR